jgi:hypothetical protein
VQSLGKIMFLGTCRRRRRERQRPPPAAGAGVSGGMGGGSHGWNISPGALVGRGECVIDPVPGIDKSQVKCALVSKSYPAGPTLQAL